MKGITIVMIYDKYKYKIPDATHIRVITNTDAKNEADDQFCIAHTLLTPRFDNVGMIAAHFGERISKRSMEDSYDELVKVFDLMGMNKNIIYKGADKAISSSLEPIMSPGAELIINEAMKDDDRPLFVTFLGPLTDLASAYLTEPKIASRLTCIWIGGGRYPEGGPEYNLSNDINAANIVFNSDIPVWQVPRNVYQMMTVSMAEMEVRVKPHGKIGEYLFSQLDDFLNSHLSHMSKNGRPVPYCECWCLGDSPVVGLMLSEHQHDYDLLPAPGFSEDMKYTHSKNNRSIRVYNNIDCRFIMEDFYAKLYLFDKNKQKNTD